MPVPHHSESWKVPPRDRNGFEVGIICALGLEFDAVRAVCDEIWSDKGVEYGVKDGDKNRYTTGRIGKHPVVLVRLTAMGKEPAARASAYLQMSYPKLRLVLLVGICGGVPMNKGDEIRLGDVVISHRIVEYDFGRLYPDGVDAKDADGRHKVDTDISAYIESLRDGDSRKALDRLFLQSLETMTQKESNRIYKSPGIHTDVLFHAKYRHKHQQPRVEDPQCRACSSQWDPVCEEAKKQSCAEVGCDDKWLVRGALTTEEPRISDRTPALHFGAMGCGNLVIKCAENRDRIARRKNVIAFEMESAGVFQTFAGVVVKGVCDYADSHKNKNWQFHAAATAAAATAAMLEQFTPSDRPQLAEISHGELRGTLPRLTALTETY
ncbi:nucleoside phosphorylase domain-containing protein [Plectosphaerella plurivora]|uniref:Nucleoside phosphorylase domain-containing protein n=1 Tax=Plectosphaerella plurivora TaxID=936078 RepID=A0A9P8VJN8_9PEZI|nr:nucleoside phosphorylase domain-containing protein [Plectosphaerella plurivora]